MQSLPLSERQSPHHPPSLRDILYALLVSEIDIQASGTKHLPVLSPGSRSALASEQLTGHMPKASPVEATCPRFHAHSPQERGGGSNHAIPLRVQESLLLPVLAQEWPWCSPEQQSSRAPHPDRDQTQRRLRIRCRANTHAAEGAGRWGGPASQAPLPGHVGQLQILQLQFLLLTRHPEKLILI